MLVWLLALAIVLSVSEGVAQPATAVPRVGIITAAPAEQPLSPNFAALVQGLREADLPIERHARFALVVHLKTVRTLGLSIPQPVLLRATQIIE
jgi:hypothetical protein